MSRQRLRCPRDGRRIAPARAGPAGMRIEFSPRLQTGLCSIALARRNPHEAGLLSYERAQARVLTEVQYCLRLRGTHLRIAAVLI
jgi:hypothetical protein